MDLKGFMDAQRWMKIEEVFQAALDLAPDARREFVNEECGSDDEMCREVNKLVARYEAEEEFLESPVWTDSRLFQSEAKREIASALEKEIRVDEKKKSRVGQRVGAYQLVEEIGVGGMGVVYLGERADGEFSQKVAIKLIKRGMDTDFIIKRFRHERQILAAFSHPNIARLFDGGTTPDGLPFFAMEYIDGEPLFKYCEKNHLDIRERLKIFREVCAAVSYAHSRHIIHRDIKPGNVLVTKEGEPKLLDFGIAKILDPDLIHESVMPTATQMRLMTPEYASPEQVCGHEVSPASDQYSLGVVLYELVTGGRPYRFPSRAPHEIARIICEEEPKSPAVAAIEAKRGAYNQEAENEITLPDREDLIGEDLERIILKSLRKKTEERYASIAEFSADIERYLKDEPIRFGAAAPKRAAKTIKPPAAQSAESQKSIAVLPFNVLDTTSAGDTGDAKFLSFGLTDSLIARLSKIRQFIVRPTSSVMRYAAPQELDSFTVGGELGVEFVLEGNVIKTDSKIRVSVQLLRVSDGAVIWADRFDESSADGLVLEDAISLKVAEALIPQLTTKEIKNLAKRGTDNAEAHEAHLRGRFHWNTFTEEGFRQAILFYQKSVELDPNYAQAYAGIADYFMWLGIFGVLSPKQSYQPAIANGRRAIEIDDELAEGYAALGFAQLCGDFDWQTSEANIRRAIELNPNYAVAHNWLAIILYTAARFDEGITHAKRAVELDPLTYQNYRTLSWGFYFSRRFDEALVVIEETIEKFPMFGVAYFNQSWAQRAAGKALEGLNSSARAMELSGGNIFVLLGHAQALAAVGKLREAEKLIETFRRQNSARYVSYYQIALVYAHAGAKEKALDALDRAMIDREGWLVWLAVEPALDLLRREPRFIRMIEEIHPPAALVENRKAGEKIGDKFSEKNGKKVSDNASGKISDRIVGAETTTGKLASPIVKSSSKSEEAKLQSSLPPNSKQKSIAVLPFKMLNPAVEDSTDEDAFMSLGLADALITRLSNVQRFIVRPTSSVLPYANNDKIDSFSAARELNVNFLLEGNILRIGRQIRVSTQLLDAAQGSTVWAERFDEDFTDVMSLEDVLSARVAASLVPQLSQGEAQTLAKRLTSEPAAYEAYMRGRAAWNIFTEDGFRRAIDYYRQAIRLDPNFAVAHAAIADYYVWLGMYGLMPSDEFYPPAREAAERAIELDPRSSEAYAALGLMELYGKYDWKTSEKHLRHAIELNQNNSVAHLWFQHTLFSQRRFEEGTKHLDRTLELDPLTFQNHNTYAWGLYFRRRFEDAVAKAREMVDRFPGTSYPYFGICAFSSAAGNAEDALWAAEKMAGISNDSLFTVLAPAQALAASGRKQEALEVVENPHLPRLAFYHKAIVYCYLKDKDKVFALLEKAFANRESALIWVGIEPSYDFVRDDARYQSLLEKMNHPLAAAAPAKKAAGAFELAPSLFASTPAPAIKAAPINKTAAPAGQNIAADSEPVSRFAAEKFALPAVAKYILAALLLIALAMGLYFLRVR